MEWLTLLLFAACPLMMLFCMKGMFFGNKKESTKSHNVPDSTETNQMQSIQVKMAELIEQNHQLTKEVHSMKETKQLNEVSDRPSTRN